ncbi:hypothetical protein QFC19_001525 [Naganishia cerealis]|uniref:Uncharacterized protein n=1 Tax=Naganishia cerealis TaxID=610337 RepID=A0ACC2WIN5_9TREE|nr:hypothetical protein QFC19_001525 [Naganishia cerealis]
MLTHSLLASLLAASSALAHYTLDYPASRGFVDDNEVNFCGGFTQPSSTRTSVPLSGNIPGTLYVAPLSFRPEPGTHLLPTPHIVQWDSHHAIGTVGIYISTAQNPTNWSDFSETMAKSWFTGDGNLYQCADLVLVEGYTVPANETCNTDVALAANATATATPSLGQSAAPSSSAPASSKGASSASGGASAAASSAPASSAGATSGAWKVIGSPAGVAAAAAVAVFGVGLVI